MPRIQSWHVVAGLALVCMFIWSADLYYESTAAPGVQTQSGAPLLSVVDSYVARSLGLPYSVPTGSGLEETSELIDLLGKYDGRPLSLDAQTQTSGCGVEGPLPDPNCTPGAVFDVGTSSICVSGYSRSVRSVSVKTKKLMYAAYGLSYPQARGAYEMDHLIPLELGGSNDVANLFPEAAEPAPGFHEKDLVENYLHDEVCAGVISLSAAQEQIARNWRAVYDTLTPATIATLKRQAASYGD